jgi:predicted nucleic acid-binding protein
LLRVTVFDYVQHSSNVKKFERKQRMHFLFKGDILRPGVIAIEAKTKDEAIAILEAASKRGSLEDAHISVYDQDSDQRMAAFNWDGDDSQESVDESAPRLRLVPSIRS